MSFHCDHFHYHFTIAIVSEASVSCSDCFYRHSKIPHSFHFHNIHIIYHLLRGAIIIIYYCQTLKQKAGKIESVETSERDGDSV
jgi:hypothetical protein